MSVRRSASIVLVQTEGEDDLLRSVLWYFLDLSKNSFCHNDLLYNFQPNKLQLKNTQKEGNQKRINDICIF